METGDEGKEVERKSPTTEGPKGAPPGERGRGELAGSPSAAGRAQELRGDHHELGCLASQAQPSSWKTVDLCLQDSEGKESPA